MVSPSNGKAVKPIARTITQTGTKANFETIQRPKATTTKEPASIGIAFFDFNLAFSSSFIFSSVSIQLQIRLRRINPPAGDYTMIWSISRTVNSPSPSSTSFITLLSATLEPLSRGLLNQQPRLPPAVQYQQKANQVLVAIDRLKPRSQQSSQYRLR